MSEAVLTGPTWVLSRSVSIGVTDGIERARYYGGPYVWSESGINFSDVGVLSEAA
jgi:hypothetical protein